MADYGNRTVGLESGNPHYMGQSIWDVMRPNPNDEQELQQNLFGAGAVGQEMPSNITEGRSPFGQMLQGIGILGPPSPRALTPFEQFMYQQGQHVKGEWDQQTQEQGIKNIGNRFALAAGVTKATGGAALPPEVANLFTPDEQNSLQAWGTHYAGQQDLLDRQKQVEFQNAQTELELHKKQLEFGLQDREEQRQQTLWNKKWNEGPMLDARHEYEYLAAMENKEAEQRTLTPARHNEYVVARNKARQKIVAIGRHIHLPEDQLQDYEQPEDPLSNALGDQIGPNAYNAQNPAMLSQQMQSMGWPPSVQSK